MKLNERDKAMILRNLRRINEYVTGFNSTFISTVTAGEFHDFRVLVSIPLDGYVEFYNMTAYLDFVVKKDSKTLSLIVNKDSRSYTVHLDNTEEMERFLPESKGWGVAIMIFLYWKDIHNQILSGIQREERIYNAIYDFKL